jgi:hypothetical protein
MMLSVAFTLSRVHPVHRMKDLTTENVRLYYLRDFRYLLFPVSPPSSVVMSYFHCFCFFVPQMRLKIGSHHDHYMTLSREV